MDNKVKELLEFSIDNGILVKLVGEQYRGKGKTTELIKASHKNNATLVVANGIHKEYVEELSKELNLNVDCRNFNSIYEIRGIRLNSKSFFVDENVDYGMIRLLIKEGNTLLGGFCRL